MFPVNELEDRVDSLQVLRRSSLPATFSSETAPVFLLTTFFEVKHGFFHSITDMSTNRRRSSSISECSDVSEARIGVVIPAGGSGQRMGITIPKQFLRINGQTVLSHTVSGFKTFPGVTVIVVVVQENQTEQVTDDFEYWGAKNDVYPPVIVLPKASETSRHLTIRAGVRELSKHNVTLTVVHDAVRPIVDHGLLHKLLEVAAKHGAAGPVTSCVSTVVSVRDNSVLEDVLDRNKLRDSQMPQVFRSDLLLDSYEASDDKDLLYGTECLLLVQKHINSVVDRGISQRTSFGAKISPSIQLVQNTDPNRLWKITYKKDVLTSVMALDPSFESMMRSSLRVFLETKEHQSLSKCLQPHPHDVKLSSRCTFISRISSLCQSLFQDVSFNTFESGILSSFMSSSCASLHYDKSLVFVIRFARNMEQFRLHVRDLESCLDSLQELSPNSGEDEVPSCTILTVMETKETAFSSSVTSDIYVEFNNLISRSRDKINFSFLVYFRKSQNSVVNESSSKLERMLTFILLKPEDFSSQIIIVW